MSYGYNNYSEPDYEGDRETAAEWARGYLAAPETFVIFDTETTGLWQDAEIVQIGLLAGDGSVLMDTLCRPAGPIPVAASAIHGITDEHCRDAPCFADLYEQFCKAIEGRTVLVYNLGYDRDILRQTCERYNLAMPVIAWGECAMIMYAQWYGEWNNYRGQYRWQKLRGGDHSAIGDCRATYRLMQKMAEPR